MTLDKFTIRFLSLILIISLPSNGRAQKMILGNSISVSQIIPIFKPDDVDFIPNVGYRLMLNFSHQLNDVFLLSSGLGFSKSGLEFIDYSPVFPCDLELDVKNGLKNSYFSVRHKMYYLSLPLHLRTKLIGEEKQLYLNSGFITSLLIAKGSDQFSHECGSSRTLLTLKPDFTAKRVLFNMNMGIGYEFNCTNSIKVYLEPYCGFSLSKIHDQNPSFPRTDRRFESPHLFSFGISLGTRYL